MSETMRRPRAAGGFLLAGRASAGHVLFGLSLAAVALAFVLFYAFFKYRIVVLGWLLCLAIFVTFWATRRTRFQLDLATLWPLLAFHTWLWISCAWAYDPQRSLWWLALDLLLPVLFFVSIAWAQNVSAWSLSWFFELTALLYTGLGIYFLITAGLLIDDRFGAVRSGMAVAMLSALPFVVWRLWQRPNPFRAGLALWCVVALVGVGSRTALVLLPVMAAAMALIVVRTSRRPLSAAFLTAVTAITVAAGMLAVPGIRSGLTRGLARFSPDQQSLDVSAAVVSELGRTGAVDIDRRLQAFVALETFLADPVLGDGYMNTYLKIRDRYHREVSAHGLPFTLLAETGLVGTVLFILMLGRFYGAVRGAARRSGSRHERSFLFTLLLTLTILLLFGLFHQVHQNPTFYILLGWGYALGISARPARARARAVPAPALPTSPA